MPVSSILSGSDLEPGVLADSIAVVTGAGRGIGLEAAKALACLGAKVVVAEIDATTGAAAADIINSEFGEGTALFVRTDISDQASVTELARQAVDNYGHVNIVLNNATAFSMGAVTDVPIEGWDRAYAVNVRAPVLLAKAFLPGMIERNRGVFVCVSSSGAAPFMGAYEVFKTAQVELARTLDAEMEGNNIQVFTIGPGLVRTPGSEEGIRTLAPLYGKTVEEFYDMSKEALLSPEEAGAGFAAAIALAERFRGQETSSMGALIAAGTPMERAARVEAPEDIDWDEALRLCCSAAATLEEQYRTWKEMSVFKRQWFLRDFKNTSGMAAEQWISALQELCSAISAKDLAKIVAVSPPLGNLSSTYAHMLDLLKGYEKDPRKLEESKTAITGWIDVADKLRSMIEGQRKGA